MTKIRRGGYVFITWVGDHPPRHVHVLRNERLIVKWNLEGHRLMHGITDPKILRLIEELESEGRL
jgi:hypothetical protein